MLSATPISLTLLGLFVLGSFLIVCGWWLLQRQPSESHANDDLLYTLTHNELANPLQSALATLDVMERRNQTVQDTASDSNDYHTREAQHDADLQDLRGSLLKLTDTTRNLRELALLNMPDRARVRDRINLVSIAQSLVVDLGPTADRQSVRLVYEGDNTAIYVLQQEQTLKRILGNVIDNAIKYSAHSEQPCVVMSVSANAQLAKIVISDNGSGMTKERLHTLGQAPQKPTAQNIGTDGSGIGLYLVHKLLEQNDGEITIDSEQGRGTIVTICMPLAKNSLKAITNSRS